MGNYKEPRLCSHCETYKTRDRTSLIRHQKACIRRQQDDIVVKKATYPSPSHSTSLSDGGNDTPMVQNPPAVQAFSTPYAHEKPKPMPSFRFPQTELSNAPPSFPTINYNLKKSPALVPNSNNAVATSTEYELKALRSRVDELEKEIAMFGMMQSQWRTLEAKVRTIETWVTQ